MGRFVLEPKSALMEEQEGKLKDSEAAISSLQVWLNLWLWTCGMLAFGSFDDLYFKLDSCCVFIIDIILQVWC